MAEIVNANITTLSRCLLCHDAPCNTFCPQGLAAGDILRKMFFENYQAAAQMQGDASCRYCSAPCVDNCVLNKVDTPVPIRKLLLNLEESKADFPAPRIKNVDLSTEICGVKLSNPFMLSSSVVGSGYDMIAKAFESGWAGVAFKTICSFPQHEASPRFSVVRAQSHSFAGFKNIEQLSNHAVEEDMEIIRRLKENYPTKVIIASIMGTNEAEWTSIAQKCEAAGADVIECNFSCPNMESADLGVTIGQSEELIERFTRAVKRGTSLPVLAKLTPNITDMVPMALAAKRGGADGIAAINTINSITSVDIDSLVAEPNVNGHSIIGGYSGKAVKPIALRFISDLANCEELQGMHISGMGGITTWRDGMEFLALGAGSLQVTTAIMEYGYRIIEDLVEGLRNYLECLGLFSVTDLVGAAKTTIVAHNQLERDTILFPLIQKDKCVGCGRCYLSCYDGGHQAITIDEATRLPKINGAKCVGCHLCKLVCPVDAIAVAKKRITRG